MTPPAPDTYVIPYPKKRGDLFLTPTLLLALAACGGGGGGGTSPRPVTTGPRVSVDVAININDSPVFIGQALKGGADGVVIAAPVALPPDAPKVTYSLKQTGNYALFDINSATGAVTLKDDLVVAGEVYSFTIVATPADSPDNGPVLAEKQVFWMVEVAKPTDRFGGLNGGPVTGDNADNVIYAGPNADAIDGGGGFNTVSWHWSDAGVKIGLGDGAPETGSGGYAQGDSLTNIQALIGSAHRDTLTGDSADNRLDGGDGDDNLDGGAGDDTLLGGAGVDTLFGGRGNDRLDGGAGEDDLRGGAGTDTASYAGSSAGVKVALGNNGANRGGDATGDQLSEIENLIGSAHNDILTGDSKANRIDGGDGDDALYGKDGDDILDGDDGNDSLIGEGGDDALDGGAGDDRLYGNAGRDALYGRAGDDTLIGGAGDDYLDGGRGADSLRGGTGIDTLYGGRGDDTLEGGAGEDDLRGGDGTDTASYAGSSAGVKVVLDNNGNNRGGDAEGDQLSEIENLIGSAHDDTLTGDAAANTLTGGKGNDSLTGGIGADKFVLEQTLLSGTDTITDFTRDQGDRILIDTATGTETTLAELGLAVVDNGDNTTIIEATNPGRIYMILENIDHTAITEANFTSYFDVI